MEINPENQYAESWPERPRTSSIPGRQDESEEMPGLGIEPGWLPQSASRLTAEHHITELLDDLYTSLHVMPGADKIQAEAEAARERVLQLERRLAEAGDTIKREIAAREAVEAQATEARDDIRALEAKIARLGETEASAQEISAKWIEESDARKSAERRADALETELKRIQSLMDEAEKAMSDFSVRIDKEHKAVARIELSRQGAENREKLALQAKEEAEARIRELEDCFDQLPFDSASRPFLQSIVKDKSSLLTSDSFPLLNSQPAALRGRENIKTLILRILIGAYLILSVYSIYVLFRGN
jgi:DNA repair exonuclease SbcCD ATPase subunit